MVKEALVKSGGALHNVTEAWFKTAGDLHLVIAVFYKTGGALVPLWDYVPPQVPWLTVGAVTNSTVALNWGGIDWGPVLRDTDTYEILERPDGASYGTPPLRIQAFSRKSDTYYFDHTQWTQAGLRMDTGYVYTVRAKRTIPSTPKNVVLYGPESPAWRIYTGKTLVTEHKEYKAKQFQPSNSETWSNTYAWKTLGNSRVGQGTRDLKNNLARNMYGCIDYSSLWNKLNTIHGTIATDEGLVTIADRIRVTKAWIQVIVRPTGFGSGRPQIYMHSGAFTIGIDVRPVFRDNDAATAEAMKFTAPPEGGGLDRHLDIDKDWADDWAKKPGVRDRNGLVIYRSDGNGQVVLAGVRGDDAVKYTNSWDLFIDYEWTIATRHYAAPTKTPYTMP